MFTSLPAALLALLAVSSSSEMRKPVHSLQTRLWAPALLSLLALPSPSHSAAVQTGNETSANGTSFVWTIEDTYAGQNFFDTWNFFTGGDPTHGMVNYTDSNTAFSEGLAYVTSNNKVIMKGDNTTWLGSGEYRNSVRISSQKQYNTGLFIMDLDHAPWGCGVWPAWWTVGGGQWPYTGEIDIIEGVHDNSHNQVTWHTGPGCNLTQNASFTGSLVTNNGQPNLDCDGTLPGNAGCGVTEWSRASYGPDFDAAGGGVFAMKWDEEGIAVWSFYRNAVPTDIVTNQPSPSLWGTPVAVLEPAGCDPIANFVNHSIIFDITFCGDWAGNSYATSGCPGTCSDRLIDPSNFVNASWTINSVKVYKKQILSGRISNGSQRPTPLAHSSQLWLSYMLPLLFASLFLWV